MIHCRCRFLLLFLYAFERRGRLRLMPHYHCHFRYAAAAPLFLYFRFIFFRRSATFIYFPDYLPYYASHYVITMIFSLAIDYLLFTPPFRRHAFITATPFTPLRHYLRRHYAALR